ncbi:DsrE family protein [Lentimicrobium sp.]|uniref:DsrE family protein n=1 Tax=Lentimicrobium sp. TaxID=2034841 RepID=UPI002CE47934|nr:DsrE family protein [Lentimicrobium sp.]HOP14154.1 DsrE family protein [Lentimicrobium sp.]HPJ62844.1 DsrE family protein [Lentimicrobium sp.]HRW68739.1 DsrE family protein [Lentimicrobium sp.]
MNRILLGLIALVFMATSCRESIEKEVKIVQDTTAMAPRDGVFYHISSGPENPHRVVMALKQAVMMAEDKDVLVYFDIKGIEVVLNDAIDISYPTFPSSKESLKLLIDKGVTIFACPSCLKAAGKSEADLMPGVVLAQKDQFFNFTKGRILTIDY